MTAALQVVVAAAVASSLRASADDVHFLLWTRSNPGDDQYYRLVFGDAASLASSPLRPEDPTVVAVHGFNSNGFSWPVRAKTELLNLGSYNVISVDWEHLAETPWYPQAVQHTQLVGERTARMLEWLQETAGLDVAQVQATGHSLGSHVCGAIGQHLEKFRLPFITGMDPAGPLFYNVTEEHRLDPSDAEFVQVIHTDACSILALCEGMEKEMGDVDFYPNGGKNQPGCSSDLAAPGEPRRCNHELAHKYWVESINGETPFLAHPCQNWDAFQAGLCDTCGQGCLQMGFHVEKNLKGTYYLRTNSASPYAMG